MRPSRLFIVISVMAALPFTVHAQESTVRGTVTDATGGVLPGVTVTLVHEASGNTFVGVTDERGEYRLGVRTGVYRLTAELPSFATVTRSGLELLLAQQAVTNLQMSPSAVQESVTVTGEAPLIDVTQSKLGGNIDTRQMQELPVNGRNWQDLTLLAPGSRANATHVNEAPVARPDWRGAFQLNLDGQQFSGTPSNSAGQPRISRDTLSEFEFVSSRFDATQGRSSGVQVNAVTKSGTNRFAGTLSGYFRDERFNARDFIVNRVLPYSNQQVSGTFGGPLKKDKAHFFGYYEGEREPHTFIATSPFPRFNIDLAGIQTEKKFGGRVDMQFSANKRLMLRGNRFTLYQPQDPERTNLATQHPSGAGAARRSSDHYFASFTQTIGQKAVNELGGGYSSFQANRFPAVLPWGSLPVLPFAPSVRLRGYSIGGGGVQWIGNIAYSVRDNFTYLFNAGAGQHELKLGGEYLDTLSHLFVWSGNGVIDATGGPIPANIQDLFPVWNDPSTWNVAPLSPITIRYQQNIGDWQQYNPREVAAAWLQDNWAVTPRLTLNLGLRYDLNIGSLAERVVAPPFRLKDQLHSDLLNFGPRLGFAYSLPDSKTVIRGGWGKYFADISDKLTHDVNLAVMSVTPEALNDGRPNFAADPYNGHPPTKAEALAGRRDVSYTMADPNVHTPYNYQASTGVQRQLGQTMAVEADYVWSRGVREINTRPINITFNPATGVNYPFTDRSTRPYPDWGNVTMHFTDGRSTYHGLETVFTKRFSNRWQASGTYTLSALSDAAGAPNVGFKVAPDFGGEYTLAATDQRHRAVFNGIWQLPIGFQLSGLYFFGSGARFTTNYGGDLRNAGGSSGGRLRPNGTIVPRNNLVGKPLHRVDLRVLRRFPIHGSVAVDGLFEVFNLFNHANYGSYVTSESNRNYGQPVQNTNLAYAARMLQLGFRFAF